jgi:hypothetical protein
MTEKSLPVLMPSEVSSRIGSFVIADGLADLMEHLADMKELRAAVGLATKEGTSHNAR